MDEKAAESQFCSDYLNSVESVSCCFLGLRFFFPPLSASPSHHRVFTAGLLLCKQVSPFVLLFAFVKFTSLM